MLSRNKKNNVYPCKPQFYYIKVGFKGVKLYRRVIDMWNKANICIRQFQPALHVLVHCLNFSLVVSDDPKDSVLGPILFLFFFFFFFFFY